MNVGQLRIFLGSITDECEVYLEGGIRAKVVCKLENGRVVIVVIPDDTQFTVHYVSGKDLED